MFETNVKETLGKINLSEHHLDEMAQLCMSEKYSDVVFIIEGQKIPAHKCILAAKDKFFQGLLYGGLAQSNQKEIELQIPLEVFKAVLQYIYSGQVCLLDMEQGDILETLVVSNMHGLTKLEHAIIDYLKEIVALNNVGAIFNVAWNCEFEGLKEVCYTFMDWNAPKLLVHESFKKFSKELLQDVLRRNSFLAPEFEIIKAVNVWCEHNPDVKADSIVSCIRLPIITVDEHLKARKFKFLNDEKLMDAMVERRASKILPYRAWPGENMAALKFGSKVIQGEWQTDSPPCLVDAYDLDGSTPAAIKAPKNEGILVELGIASIINHIKFQLWEGDGPYSYFVEVSSNRSQWEKIADYREYDCRLWQTLYFSPKFVKYIKLVGTRKMGLTIVALKAMYTEIVPKLVNGFIAATVEMCGRSRDKQEAALFCNEYGEEGNNGILANDGDVETEDDYVETDDKLVLKQLDQPYYISSLRLLLWNNPSVVYSYNIYISENKDYWQRIVTKKGLRTLSWQNIPFSQSPVIYIKITCNRFCRKITEHYVHIEEVEEAKPARED